MILVEKLRISPDRSNLEIIVSCSPSDRFTKLRLVKWDDFDSSLGTANFTSGTDYIDLDSILDSNSNYETIYLPLDSLTYTKSDGNTVNITSVETDTMYFIYFETANSITGVQSSPPESRYTVVCPLTHFYYCLLDKTLTLRTKCDTCLYDVEILYFLINGVKYSIQLDMYTEAIEFWRELTVLCDYNCVVCNQENDTQEGIGVWVINDNFVVG